MKLFLPLTAMLLLGVPAKNCNETKKESRRLKAKLEIKAMCMNYTLRLEEGNLDTSLIVSKWKDDETGKTYENVFGLANPCDFPSTIKQGDEFYFTIDTAKNRNCAVCMAYYPTPRKKLIIKVIQ